MVKIKRYDGSLVEFDPKRIQDTLNRIQSPPEAKKLVMEEVQKKLKEGMSTSQIYKIVFTTLKKCKRKFASKYSLKKAIIELGPKGYNFEDFICGILGEKGYSAEVRQVLNGEVITHEMDVIAHKGSESIAIECKFHQNEHIYSPIQTALYVYARFLDIVDGYEKGKEKRKIDRIMIATNTRFSSEAIAYSKSKEIELLSWDYPKDRGIRDIVDEKGLYPITVLTRLKKIEKTKLIEKGKILVKDLTEKDVNPKVTQEISELLSEA